MAEVWRWRLQVTALGLITAGGKVGNVPTGVQFALKGMSASKVGLGAFQ